MSSLSPPRWLQTPDYQEDGNKKKPDTDMIIQSPSNPDESINPWSDSSLFFFFPLTFCTGSEETQHMTAMMAGSMSPLTWSLMVGGGLGGWLLKSNYKTQVSQVCTLDLDAGVDFKSKWWLLSLVRFWLAILVCGVCMFSMFPGGFASASSHILKTAC